MDKFKEIRPIVLGVVRKGNKLLVSKGYDKSKNQEFYRCLGGGIEFLERSEDALKRELLTLSVDHYMRTVKDIRFPNRSEMREFGKVYNEKDDVYIKIRIELLGMYGSATTFVMSFHFAEKAFTPEMFPYKKK